MAYSPKSSPAANTSYSAGHYEFTLDGSTVSGYVKNVSGGVAKGALISETVGPELLQFKHIGTVEIEPINVEMAMSVAKPVLEWIRASWERRFERKNGVLRHADSNYKSRVEQEFQGALITETVFPTLDGSASENAYLKVSLLPEAIEIKPGSGHAIQAQTNVAQYDWSPGSFRVNIDGIDCSRVSRVESFSVKQQVKKLYVGRARFPEIEPAAIEFSNITLQTSAAFADAFIKWHHDYVVKGQKESKMEKQGSIEFLSNDRTRTLFTVKLENIGIQSLSIEGAEANAAKIKRCKIELYVERMALEYSSSIS